VWKLRDLLNARRQLQAGRKCRAFAMLQPFTSLSQRLKQVSALRVDRRRR
jgi:hypothetical protein